MDEFSEIEIPNTYEEYEGEKVFLTNAKIESVQLGYCGYNVPTAWVHLTFDSGGQGFGGYHLGGPAMNVFVMGLLETLEIDEWNKLPGQIVRIKRSHSKVHEIGHPIKNKWFNPRRKYEEMEKEWVCNKPSEKPPLGERKK